MSARGQLTDRSRRWLIAGLVVLDALGCNNGGCQRWQVSAGGGGMQLRNARTGPCVGSTANHGTNGVRLRGTVYATACDGQSPQIWTMASEQYGEVFRNSSTGECLDSNASGSVYTQDYNGGKFQHRGPR
jgi:hypothetical protein